MRILYVEDDPSTRRAVSQALRARGLEVKESAQLPTTAEPCDVLLLDLTLSDTGGAETLEQAIDVFSLVPIVILTGDGRPEVHGQCVQLGAYHVVTKPADMGSLASTLHQAKCSAQRVGADPARALRRLAMAGESMAVVLLGAHLQ